MTTQPHDTPSIVPSLEPVGRLLREGVLEVPPYQRSYAWEAEQVDTFWLDLRAALVADEPLYFLGTVVISTGTTDRSVVIDGQQRLATSSLLFSAIRDIFASKGDAARAQTIRERYLTWASLESTNVEPRLALNEQDRAYFNAIALEGQAAPPPTEGDPDSVARLHDAFQRLSRNLHADIDAAGTHWQDRLLAWVGFLDRRVRTIVVRVRDDADAFLIFETLNARGLELSAADLIKNYLFGLCRHRLTDAQEAWGSLARNIETSASSTEITTFVRHWWASRNGAVREKELYRKIKRSVQSQDQAILALEGLTRAAPLYSAMLSSEHEFWADQDTGASAAMATLLDLGLEQYRPLLLAGLERFDRGEVKRLLLALTAWSVRGLVVGGIGGGTTERYYAEAAVRISNGRVDSAAQVLEDLRSVVPGDDDFAAVFQARRVTRTRLLHYYLRALHETRPDPSTDLADTAAVPIVPRSDPSGLWTDFIDAESLAKAATRVGNFALIPREHASGLPRDPVERIELLTSIDLLVPARRSEWSIEAIAERQARLAALAPRTWPQLPS